MKSIIIACVAAVILSHAGFAQLLDEKVRQSLHSKQPAIRVPESVVAPKAQPTTSNPADKAPVVILPERFSQREVLVKNSAAFKQLVSENRGIARQLQIEQTQRENFENSIDAQLRQQAAELSQLRAEVAKLKTKKSGFGGFILGLLNIGVMFFTNPLGWIMNTMVQIVIGITAAFVIFLLVRFLYRKLTKPGGERPAGL